MARSSMRRSLLFREQPFIEGTGSTAPATGGCHRSLLFREQPFIEGRVGLGSVASTVVSLLFRKQPFIEGCIFRRQ